MKQWIQTFTGRQFWPLQPNPDDIDIEDIAHALSMKCRYSGHCRTFYSVAEHSVLVSQNVGRADALWGLLHDAPEAYSPFGDVPKPIKNAFPMVAIVERDLMAAICTRFGMPHAEPAAVKVADTRILLDEKAQVMGPSPALWEIDVRPLGVHIRCLSPGAAKEAFLRRFFELTSEPGTPVQPRPAGPPQQDAVAVLGAALLSSMA